MSMRHTNSQFLPQNLSTSFYINSEGLFVKRTARPLNPMLQHTAHFAHAIAVSTQKFLAITHAINAIDITSVFHRSSTTKGKFEQLHFTRSVTILQLNCCFRFFKTLTAQQIHCRRISNIKLIQSYNKKNNT